MTTKHTPGPWRFDYYSDNIRGSGITVARDVMVAADTSLIAAAPETLAMLEESLPHLEDYFDKEYGDAPPEIDLLERVRAVIAKAKGGG